MGKKKTKIKLTPDFRGGRFRGYRDREGNLYSFVRANELVKSGEATKAQWKNTKRAKETYEGTQYTGGRKEGRKNLKKTATGYVNQHGVEFTAEERKDLERAVNRVNAKRKRMLEAEGNLPRLVGGKPTGGKVSELQTMGKESDFIISRKSKSLQRFKSREDFERYMKNLRDVGSPEWLDTKTREYKRNHMKAIENVFGDEASDVLMKIRMMKPKDYRELLQSDEDLEVSYVYDPSERTGKLNRIRAALGMKLKEEPIEEE